MTPTIPGMLPRNTIQYTMIFEGMIFEGMIFEGIILDGMLLDGMLLDGMLLADMFDEVSGPLWAKPSHKI